MTTTEENEILSKVIMWLHPQYKDYDKAVKLLYDNNLVVSIDKETDDRNFEAIKSLLIDDIERQKKLPDAIRLSGWLLSYANKNIKNGRIAYERP